MPQDDVRRGPIFIVGAMGSGTTLLRLILDSHDDIAIAQETGIARSLLAGEHVPYYQFGDGWHERIGWSRDELDVELGRFYSGLFQRFAAQRGATRWGDKTPYHIWHIPLLARVFPDGTFVGIIRHPAAVATSIQRRMRFPWARSVRHWGKMNTMLLREAAALGDRMVLCRYEDVVGAPEPVLRELLDHLGVTWSERILDFHQVQRERGTPREVEGQTRSDKPLRADRVGAWLDARTDQQRTVLHERPRITKLATFLGYDLDVPAPTGPLAGSLTCLADGDGVRRHMAAHPGDVPMKPLEPSMVNRPLQRDDLLALRRRARGQAQDGPLTRLAMRGDVLARGAANRLPAGVRAGVRRVVERGRQRR